MLYILISAVALVLLNVYTSNTMRSITFRAGQQSLEAKTRLISSALLQAETMTPAEVERVIDSLEDLNTTRTVVTDAGGGTLYDSYGEAQLVLFPEILTALRGNDVFYSVYVDRAVESRAAVPLTRHGEILGVVYLMEYDTEQGILIDSLQNNILRISFALEVCIILVSLIFSGTFSRRIRRILHSVRKMQEGDYRQRIDTNGRNELDRLGQAFNDLAERLEESEARRRQFVSDASHELKTPLASIKLLADSILQNEMDVQTQREFVGDIGREADRLGRLSQKLLTLTRLDSALEEEREIIPIAPTVEKVARMLRPLAQLRGITIETRLTTDCTILTVEDDLYQIVFNLTENAIKYNKEGGSVLLTLLCEEENTILTVEDTGMGIPPEAQEHIFLRFYRVDKARSRAAGGAGLGLSIVHDMVERNFGTISVASRDGGGSIFTVTFPKFEPEGGDV